MSDAVLFWSGYAARSGDGPLSAAEFWADFTDMSLARSFAREFPQLAGMEAHVQDGRQQRFFRAHAVCDLEPTPQNPGAAASGIAQFRSILRVAGGMVGASVEVVYRVGRERNAVGSEREFRALLARAEELNGARVRV